MLKKIVFFIPAIVFAAAFAAIGMGLSFSPVAYVWIALFILSGILLWTDRFWGAFLESCRGFN